MAKVISSIAVLRNEMVLFVYCRKLNCNQQTPVTETQWRCETQVTVFLAEEVEGKADNLNGESFFFFLFLLQVLQTVSVITIQNIACVINLASCPPLNFFSIAIDHNRFFSDICCVNWFFSFVFHVGSGCGVETEPGVFIKAARSWSNTSL